MKTIREKFKIKVIEAIHNLPFEEIDESSGEGSFIMIENRPFRPITIGRVMQALNNTIDPNSDDSLCLYPSGEIYKCSAGHNYSPIVLNICWKLIKENSQEADDDFQDDETDLNFYFYENLEINICGECFVFIVLVNYPYYEELLLNLYYQFGSINNSLINKWW